MPMPRIRIWVLPGDTGCSSGWRSARSNRANRCFQALITGYGQKRLNGAAMAKDNATVGHEQHQPFGIQVAVASHEFHHDQHQTRLAKGQCGQKAVRSREGGQDEENNAALSGNSSASSSAAQRWPD